MENGRGSGLGEPESETPKQGSGLRRSGTRRCTNRGGVIWATERVHDQVRFHSDKGARAKDVGHVPWSDEMVIRSVNLLLSQLSCLQLEYGWVVVSQEGGFIKATDLRLRT